MTKEKIDAALAHIADAGTLAKFISVRQRGAMAAVLKGEEGEFMADKIESLLATIAAAPVTYQQDGMGDKAVVHLHYFHGGMDFFITELDKDDQVSQAFGLAVVHEAELGYISITELVESNVELDLYWAPKPLSEARKSS